MSTTRRGQSPVLDGYLDELDAATAHLPADEAYEIRDSIAAHIADATRGASHVSDDDARRIVRDLGPVSMIVQAAGSSETATTQALPTPGATTPSPATQTMPQGQPSPEVRRGPGYARIAGILATVTAVSLCLFWPLSLVTGLCAIGFGIAGLRAGESRAESWTGIGVGLLPIVLSVIYAVFGMAVTGGSSGESSSSGPDMTRSPAMVQVQSP